MISILALDLSLTCTGYCIDGQSGRIASRQRGWERIAEILRTVRDLANGVDLVTLEDYAYKIQGNAGVHIAGLGEIVRFWLWTHHYLYVDVPIGTLKKWATGKGNAQKDAMIAAAIRRFGFKGEDNNEADAHLLWCMARHAYGEPVADVPALQAAELAKVNWPVMTLE